MSDFMCDVLVCRCEYPDFYQPTPLTPGSTVFGERVDNPKCIVHNPLQWCP